MGVQGFGGGLAWVVSGQFFLILLTKRLSSNGVSNTIEAWNSGTPPQPPLWMRPSTPSMKLSIP